MPPASVTASYLGATLRVVHFTTVHPALDPRIFRKECAALAAAGHEVTLVAPTAPDSPIPGITLVPAAGLSGGGRIKRIVGGKTALARQLLRLRADSYHAHDPELLPVLVALRLRGKVVVYDAHEHLRDSLSAKAYVNPVVRRALVPAVGLIERILARACNLVVAATPKIAAQFPAGRTVIVRNYPAVEELSAPPATLSEYLQRPAYAAYIGAITDLRRGNEMFAAADALQRRFPASRLVAAGKLYQVDDPADHPGVDYRGIVGGPELARILAEARVGVALLADTAAYNEALPTKFYEYAAAGLPVIASRSTKAMSRLIEDHDCGLLVDGRDVDEIVQAMTSLFDDPARAFEMGQRGAAAVRSSYTWSTEACELVAAYQRLEQR